MLKQTLTNLKQLNPYKVYPLTIAGVRVEISTEKHLKNVNYLEINTLLKNIKSAD